MKFITRSPEETLALGRKLSAEMRPPALILLIGDLGTGKTTLTKGFLSGWGVAREEDVLSPTFSLIHEYGDERKVYHVDLYRLDRIPELETLGLEELWEQDSAVLIEWGEKFAGKMPSLRWEIHIRDLGGAEREFRVERVAS